MITNKQDLKFYLQEDKKRMGIKDNILIFFVKLICGSEMCRSYNWIKVYRKWEYHHNVKHSIRSKFYEILTKRIGLKLGIYADINTIGYGLRIIHFTGGGGARIKCKSMGNYCGVNSGVMIGKSGDDESCRPVIGDHVAFGPGAKAFGKLFIGDNVFIAPNAVVTHDCKSNAIYGGVPAKFIKDKQPIAPND